MLVRDAKDLPRLLQRAGIAVDEAPRVLGAWHLQASFSVWRRSAESLALLREWIELICTAETNLTSISDQAWLSLLAVKHGHTRALWSRSLGVRADSTVGGQRGHADPNAVKNINVALAAVARNRSPRFVGAETYAPVRAFL